MKTLTPQIYQFLQSELQFEKVAHLSSNPFLPFPYPVHWYKIFFILCRIGLFWPFTSWRRPTWPTRARPWQRDKPLVQREGKTRDHETTCFICYINLLGTDTLRNFKIFIMNQNKDHYKYIFVHLKSMFNFDAASETIFDIFSSSIFLLSCLLLPARRHTSIQNGLFQLITGVSISITERSEIKIQYQSIVLRS